MRSKRKHPVSEISIISIRIMILKSMVHEIEACIPASIEYEKKDHYDLDDFDIYRIRLREDDDNYDELHEVLECVSKINDSVISFFVAIKVFSDISGFDIAGPCFALMKKYASSIEFSLILSPRGAEL